MQGEEGYLDKEELTEVKGIRPSTLIQPADLSIIHRATMLEGAHDALSSNK